MAGKTIDQLSAGSSLSGTEKLPMFQGSNPAVYTTPAALAAYVGALANATADITFIIDGGGANITTGLKGFLSIDFACVINQVTLLADVSGSIVVDIRKCTYAQFDAGATHPVSGDSITASAKPTISSAVKGQDSTLSGWTTSIAAGDVLGFNVNSASSVQRVTVTLKVTK